MAEPIETVSQPPADAPAAAPVDAKPVTPADVMADSRPEADAGSASPPPAGNTGLLGLHSAIEFGVMAANRQPLEASNAAFHEQVRRIAGNLQAAARVLYPEQMKRLGAFDVYVGDAENCSTMSSGTGKVAINAGFSKRNPADDWLAFVVAREMGHVLAGHHDNNSGASLAVSVLMNFIVPGSGVIKSVISFAGSQIAANSGHDRQLKEADEVAMKLLEGAGYTRKSVALNLRLAPLAADIDTSWAKDFRASALHLTGAPLAPVADTATAAAGVAATLQDAGVAQTAVPLAAPPANWRPDDLARTRPSGLPGPLYVGGYAVPSRYVE
ncbi:MAG TPA: M48 family metalloprotease [Burkholderiales bacterium]